jgi:excisionase family DNA binding protein
MSMNTHLTFSTLSEEAIKQIIEKSIQSTLLESAKEPIQAEEDIFLTRKETIKILGITLPTLRAWTVAGKIPCYRISSLIRYKRSEVIAYVESGRIKRS